MLRALGLKFREPGGWRVEVKGSWLGTKGPETLGFRV